MQGAPDHEQGREEVLLRGVGVDVELETMLSSAERPRDEGVWAKVRRSLMAMLQKGQENSATASRILKRTIRRDLQTSLRPPHAAQSTREQIQGYLDTRSSMSKGDMALSSASTKVAPPMKKFPAMQISSFVDMRHASCAAVNAFYDAAAVRDDADSAAYASRAYGYVNDYQCASALFQSVANRTYHSSSEYDAVAALYRCGEVIGFNPCSINKGDAAFAAAAHDIIYTACKLHAVYHTAAVLRAASFSSIAACNGEAYYSVAGRAHPDQTGKHFTEADATSSSKSRRGGSPINEDVQENTSRTITDMTNAAYKLGAACEFFCNRMWADVNKEWDVRFYDFTIREVKKYACACERKNNIWWGTANAEDKTTKVLKDACSELTQASRESRYHAELRNEEDSSIAAAVHAQVAGMYQAAAAYHANAAYRAAAVSPAVASSRLTAIRSEQMNSRFSSQRFSKIHVGNLDTSSTQAFWDGALTELGSVLTSTAGDVRTIDGGSTAYAGTMKDPSAGPVVSEGADNEHGDRVADSRNNDRAMVDAGRTIDAGPGPDVSEDAIGGPFEFDSDDDVEDVDNQDATHKESGTTEDPGTAIHAGKGPIISKDDDCEGGEEDADQGASSEDACTVGGNGSTIDVDADRVVSEDKDCGFAADPGHDIQGSSRYSEHADMQGSGDSFGKPVRETIRPMHAWLDVVAQLLAVSACLQVWHMICEADTSLCFGIQRHHILSAAIVGILLQLATISYPGVFKWSRDRASQAPKSCSGDIVQAGTSFYKAPARARAPGIKISRTSYKRGPDTGYRQVCAGTSAGAGTTEDTRTTADGTDTKASSSYCDHVNMQGSGDLCTRPPPKTLRSILAQVAIVTPRIMGMCFLVWGMICTGETAQPLYFGVQKSQLLLALAAACLPLTVLTFFVPPLKHFYLDVCVPRIQWLQKACGCALQAREWSEGDVIQAGTTLYEVLYEVELAAPGIRLKPDICDPYAWYRQVGCTWGLRNRSRSSCWDLECSFLIYAAGLLPPDHVNELRTDMESELAPLGQPGDAPFVTTACVCSYKRTWQRVLTMPFRPQEVSPRERKRLSEGDNCYRVYVVISRKFPDETNSESKSFKMFKDWRKQVVPTVKAAALAWCGRYRDGVRYIDSGVGPWSLLLHEGWHKSAAWLTLWDKQDGQ